MDADKNPTYAKTYYFNIIEERELGDSKEVKKENIHDIFKPKSILNNESNSSFFESSLDKHEKNDSESDHDSLRSYKSFQGYRLKNKNKMSITQKRRTI